MKILIGPRDRAFADSPDAGDPKCVCSRCGKSFEEEDVPIRCWPEVGGKMGVGVTVEYRYHTECVQFA